MERSINFYVGIAGWTVAVVAAVTGLSSGSNLSLDEFARTTARTVFNPADTVITQDDSSRLRVGDPVFGQTSDNRWTQVGSVQKLGPRPGLISLAWYGDQPASEFDLTSHFQTGRLDEVIQTMLPPEQQDRISAKVAMLINQHGAEMAESILPLLKESLQRSMPVVESAMRDSVARHRNEINDLAVRWNEEIVREQLVPLAREEILPIVRRHAQPVVEDVGRQLWDRASLWRFGWRAVYDKSPLPKQDLVQDEWDRFVEEQAVPILESHTDEMVDAVQKTVQGIAKNPRVRAGLGTVAAELASDPASKQLLATILRETLVENDSLRDVWQSVWTSDEAKLILNQAGNHVEPVVREIGDELFGTPENGINANFARVLRQQVLGKDRRFVIARVRKRERPSNSPIVIHRGRQSMPYPVVYLANPDAVESLR